MPKEQPTESAEERRKREINAIKQEVEFLNKRMENTMGRKGDGESKPYFQLPSRKNVQNSQPTTNLQEPSKPTFQLNANTVTEPPASDPNGHKAFFNNYKSINQ